MQFLQSDARTAVVSDLARVMNSRPSSIARKSDEAIAADVAQKLTLLRPQVKRSVLAAVFDHRGERALMFNQLVGLVVGTEVEQDLSFTVETLEPYRSKYGDTEFDLAIHFVAEHGHPACRASAFRIRDSDAEQARKSQLSRSMQERAVECGEGVQTIAPSEPVAPPAPSQAPDPFVEEWKDAGPAPESTTDGPTAVPGGHAAEGGPPASTGTGGDRAREFSEDWSCAEMRDDVLDRIVIRAIVASVTGEEGALTQPQLREFVSKVHKLNTGRFKSYFYIGFIDALQLQLVAQPGGGMNSPRRAWYLAGYHFGMRRMKTDEGFLDGIEAITQSDLEALADPLARGAAQKLLSPVVRAAVQETRVEVIARWLQLCGPYDRSAVMDAVRFALKEQGVSVEQNAALLAACLNALQMRREIEGIAAMHQAELALLFSLIGCFREIHGWTRFTRGLRQIRRLSLSGDAAAEISVACAMHDLHIVRPLKLIPSTDEALERSARVLPVFVRQLGPHVEKGVLDDIASVLRVIAEASAGGAVLSSLEVVETVERVQSAYAAIATSNAARFGTFPKEEVVKSLEVLSAIAVVVVPLEDRFAESAAVVYDWIAAGHRLPPSVLQVAFQSLLLLDSPIVAEFFVECVKLHGPDFVKTDAVARIVTMPDARAAREVILKLLEDDRVSLPTDQRWELASILGRAAATGGVDPRLAVVCIDHLERIVDSHRKQFGRKFIDLLAQDCWQNVLDEELRESKQIDIASQIGDYASVGEQYSGMLQRALATADFGAAAEAVDALDSHGLRNWVKDEQRAHLASLRSDESDPADKAGDKARVLLVGGNEVQANYDQRLRDWFAKEAPRIQLEFIHSGWKSNWSEYVAQVERRLKAGAGSPDAIVVITMIRTILGEKVRALAGEYERPWVACTGRGFESLRRSALKAAQLGAAKRGGRTGGA